MTAAEHWDFVSEEDYLRGELLAEQKHEYVGGVVYVMAGGRIQHNDIAGNVFGSLFSRLRGGPCKPQNSNTKVRIRLATGTRFYYPDTMVVCRSNPKEDTFQDEPVLIAEVLSESTRRIDEGEKKDAYLTISSLGVYLMVEQERPLAVAMARTPNGFERTVYKGLDAIVPLPDLETELPLAEIYEGADFSEST
ncbi:MAG: Uma2 family endonuclease [Verrucomicrobiota bacterium]